MAMRDLERAIFAAGFVKALDEEKARSESTIDRTTAVQEAQRGGASAVAAFREGLREPKLFRSYVVEELARDD